MSKKGLKKETELKRLIRDTMINQRKIIQNKGKKKMEKGFQRHKEQSEVYTH